MLACNSPYDTIDYQGKYIPGLGWNLWKLINYKYCYLLDNSSDTTPDIQEWDCMYFINENSCTNEIEIYDNGILKFYTKHCRQDFYSYDKNSWLQYEIKNNMVITEKYKFYFDITTDLLLLFNSQKDDSTWQLWEKTYKKLDRFKAEIHDSNYDP